MLFQSKKKRALLKANSDKFTGNLHTNATIRRSISYI
jgi:hypothetical protein